MELHQLDADLITGFLHHLEADRANSARTRNARLAAIHSMFAYAALRAPEDSATIQQVLAIEGSRTQRRIICWLTDDEAGALLTAPDLGTWIGRRDRTLILLALTTGLRVSEARSAARRMESLGVERVAGQRPDLGQLLVDEPLDQVPSHHGPVV